MDAYIASHPFVRMTEEDWVLNWHFGHLETPVGSQWNDLLDTMASLLEGFETELVTEADGTYQFSASGSDLLSLADRFLLYLQDNPTAGYGMALTWQTFKQDFLSSNGINAPSPALTESSWQASLQKQADRWSKQQASERQAPIGANDSIAVSLKMTGNPGSRVLTSASSLVIDKVGAAIQTSAVLTEQTIQGVPYFNAVSGNTFDAGLEAINDRYTLTTGVRLEPEEDGFASAFIEQTFCGRPSGNLNYASMYYINNQYYIGANDLTRILPGAQVTAAHGQATIVFNGRTAVLDTQPALNTSDKEVPFVSVRELTQLGLSVDYQSPPEIITLTFQ